MGGGTWTVGPQTRDAWVSIFQQAGINSTWLESGSQEKFDVVLNQEISIPDEEPQTAGQLVLTLTRAGEALEELLPSIKGRFQWTYVNKPNPPGPDRKLVHMIINPPLPAGSGG
jgi:hypothetical protein